VIITPTLRLLIRWMEQAEDLDRQAKEASGVERERLFAAATVTHQCVRDFWNTVADEFLELSQIFLPDPQTLEQTRKELEKATGRGSPHE
jgi:hypothetical protein